MTINQTQPQHDSQATRDAVLDVYDYIAQEYDERIPGTTTVDASFMATEMSFVLDHISPTDQVLDMGCGTGRFTEPLGRQAQSVVGLDLTPGMLEKAKDRCSGLSNASFQQGDMCELPFEDDSFDVVVSMLALMHLPPQDRQRAFQETARVLRPGGRALFGVKNEVFERMSGVDRFASVDITDVDNKDLVFTSTRDGADRRAPWHSFTPMDLRRLFATAGMITVQTRGNSTLSTWLSDSVLADESILGAVQKLESVLGDTAPFNHLGYHLLVEAVKPAPTGQP
ncbi:class I SAM-dependent methyltransferase [Luteipulveratus flavus]|uniref:Class I SAM-dependent methyltransferase n=1 Tax=Luteipulveratus flavus TaxID=3031728 RepID=A0ABT6C3E5_9MICO|nr:class I SAM-dependent methyltransferase [Luteipulveratus sp. YIM 133296]MDF8263215.1 class I SAM-dependent methyltransferase [Luteipulveratus sp. YIM 133296]